MWEDKSRTIQQTDRRKGLAIHRNHCAAIYKNRRSVKKPEPESKDIRGNERKKTIWDWFQSVQCCGAAGPCESKPNRIQVFFLRIQIRLLEKQQQRRLQNCAFFWFKWYQPKYYIRKKVNCNLLYKLNFILFSGNKVFWQVLIFELNFSEKLLLIINQHYCRKIV